MGSYLERKGVGRQNERERERERKRDLKRGKMNVKIQAEGDFSAVEGGGGEIIRISIYAKQAAR